MQQHHQESAPIAQPRGGATLLVIEDSEALRRGLYNVASEMAMFDKVLMASDGLEGYRILRQEAVDIVLCDLQMPRCDGLGFLRLQRRDPKVSHIPVIVLTASDDWQTKVKALDSGASDYLAKPANPEETRARLGVHLKLKQMHDDLLQKTEELERLTRTDGLTGVANRRHLDELIAREHARAARYKRPLSLLMIDIDHFKKLNDTLGHQAGDEALRELGALLRSELRGQDGIARYGGEEFAVLLPETDANAASLVAERLRAQIAALHIDFQGKPITITASIGVSGASNGSMAQPADLVSAADAALYDAKQQGRNRVVCSPIAHRGEADSPDTRPREQNASP